MTRSQWAEKLGLPYKKAVYKLRKYEMKNYKMTFMPPKGAVPEGTKAGDEFDLVTTYRLTASGECCITRMGDMPVGGEENKGKPDYRRYTDDMRAGMTNQTEGMAT